MSIHFTKMQGLGNDFIIIDKQSQNIELTSSLIQTLCDRHYGIGCDQLLVINKTKNTAENHFDYQIFNADGSEAEQCGNGARCVASYLFETQKIKTPNIILHTKNRQIEIIQSFVGSGDECPFTDLNTQDLCTLKEGERSSPLRGNVNNLNGIITKAPIYKVKMGVPEFDQFNTQLNYFPISMGNPHAVIIVADINNALVDDIGKQFNNNHPNFPQGVNVGFAQVVNRQTILLRVYERGAGETLACGSGACAAVVAGILLGLLDTTVTVHLKGGILSIEWPNNKDALWMSGPAIKVFDGTV